MNRTLTINTKKPVFIVWILVALYMLLFLFITFWKYQHNLYDNLDLAIFNNTFFNTANGDWFRATIHPTSYLGDHFSPFILFLTPLYLVWSDPRLLLTIQTVAVALSAVPLYLISKKRFTQKSPLLFLLAPALWLFNPSVHNMTIFEFSLVPFAVLALLFAIYFYQRNQLVPFVVALALAITTREDVSFIVFFFGILAAFDRRPWKWIALPVGLATIYATIAFSLISFFAPAGSYKFLLYYGWLGGGSAFEIASSLLGHPLKLIQHFFTFGNFEFIAGLTFPFLFVVLSPHRYFILLIPPLAATLLSVQGGSALMFQTHYAGLFLLILMPVAIEKINALNNGTWPRLIPRILRERRIWIGLTVAATLYAASTYGSLLPVTQRIIENEYAPAPTKLLSFIPDSAAVAASWSLLTPFSSRDNIYSLHYALIEKNQFALSNYTLPDNTEYLAIDWEDVLKGRVHIDDHPRYKETIPAYQKNLAEIFDNYELLYADGPYALFKQTRGLYNGRAHLLIETFDAKGAQAKPLIAGYARSDDTVSVVIAMPQKKIDPLHYYLTIETDRRSFDLPLGYGLVRQDAVAKDLDMKIYLASGENLTAAPTIVEWKSGRLVLGGVKNLETKLDRTILAP